MFDSSLLVIVWEKLTQGENGPEPQLDYEEERPLNNRKLDINIKRANNLD